MEKDDKELWVDRYCPKTLDEYVLDGEIKAYFKAMLDRGTVQNFTLCQCQGSGKTTLAKIVSRTLGAETLFVKCATEGTIDVLRTKVQEFCNAMTFGKGDIKLVILDEVDSASSNGDSSFQKGLRTLIEAAQDDTRFILTANYETKIIPAILSRCPLIPLRFGQRDLLARIKAILDAEKVKYGRESLKAFIEEAFHFYPDCRRIVSYLQFCCQTGELVVKLGKVADQDGAGLARAVFDMAASGTDLLQVRKFYLQSKDKVQDMVAFGSDLYNAAVDSGKIGVDGVLRMTDLLYQLNVVIDKDVGLFGLIAAVAKYAGK